eukprot:1186107-Prorocentrum_minimum.AAC.5
MEMTGLIYAQAESHSKRPGDSTQPTVRQSSSPRRICIDHLRMTKYASEEPGGVLRDRIWSNCVQPDDLPAIHSRSLNSGGYPEWT